MNHLLNKYSTILWDFDGVILNSMSIRTWGFKEIFADFPGEEVQKLLDYHNENGGLSRYHKIAYFFQSIRNQTINDELVDEYASRYSELMLNSLLNKEYLINDSLDFIQENYTKKQFHIVSGSDQNELRFICKTLHLDDYFITILGSPEKKSALVDHILQTRGYNPNEVCLIGDSINDHEAAKMSSIDFLGYNNKKIHDLGEGYIESFSNVDVV